MKGVLIVDVDESPFLSVRLLPGMFLGLAIEHHLAPSIHDPSDRPSGPMGNGIKIVSEGLTPHISSKEPSFPFCQSYEASVQRSLRIGSI
jgi:hypothetical protein